VEQEEEELTKQDKNSKSVNQKTEKSVNQEISNMRIDELGEGFEINADLPERDTYEFTSAEFDTVKDLTTQLTREFQRSEGKSLKFKKSDLLRCAVNQMIDDYRKNGDNSFLIRHLKQKKPREQSSQ
jgi:hypothetical protein